MDQKNIEDMTQTEFRALPEREPWDADIGLFDAIVILPNRRKHDSGFRCMDFVAVRKNIPLCRLAGGSDVLHVGGISPPLLHPEPVA